MCRRVCVNWKSHASQLSKVGNHAKFTQTFQTLIRLSSQRYHYCGAGSSISARLCKQFVYWQKMRNLLPDFHRTCCLIFIITFAVMWSVPCRELNCHPQYAIGKSTYYPNISSSNENVYFIHCGEINSYYPPFQFDRQISVTSNCPPQAYWLQGGKWATTQ